MLSLQECRTDYERWLLEYGFSHPQVRAVVEDMRDHIDMPPEFDAAELRQSPIHGLGMFATRAVKAGEVIAPARIAGRRTHAGRYTNHSTRPNARFIRQAPAADADLLMVATGELAQGDEVLMDYRQAGSANGSGAQPDRALSIETVRMRLHGTEPGQTLGADELDHFLTGVWLALRYIPAGIPGMIRNGHAGRAAAHVGALRAGLLIGCAQRAPVPSR